MTKTDIQEQLKASMLARNAEKTSVLRLVLSAITYYEIQKGGAGYTATEEDIQTVIQKEAKQRRESIEEFKKGKRQDLVDKETKELEILQVYLPKQLSPSEIRDLVKQVISESQLTSPQDFGKLMGKLMQATKGKADGTVVNQIAREELQNVETAA